MMIMKMKAEGWAISIYMGIIMIALILFAHTEIFATIEGVFFDNPDASVIQSNVTGNWAEIGITSLYFAVLVIIILGTIFMLIGRGGT